MKLPDAPVNAEATAALYRGLQDCVDIDCEYGAGLSTHLPMALAALHRLGADAARLQAFARVQLPRLRPAPPAQAWVAGEAWAARLGETSAWPAYRGLFLQWLQFDGAGEVLATVLPRLLPGSGAAAFHGLIRTAYAVQVAQRLELADALAYWACRWAPVPEPGDDAPTLADPAAVLRRLPVLQQAPAGRLIADDMADVQAQSGWADAVARLQVNDATLEQLARRSAELYATSGNFTALHLLTSAHALRVLLPCVDEPLAAVRDYWRAFAAGWVASGARQLGAPPLQPWEDIVAFAVASDDDHVVKLVDSCREQQRAYGGEVWQRAASRVLAGG